MASADHLHEEPNRDARALQLRQGGATYRQIADSVGYASAREAQRAAQRAMLEAELDSSEESRRIEESRLDHLTRVLMKVLATKHYVTSAAGRVVLNPITREPLADDGPIIAAVAGLMRISERRSRLLGLDSPSRHEVTIDQIDQQIRELEAQLAREGRDRA